MYRKESITLNPCRQGISKEWFGFQHIQVSTHHGNFILYPWLFIYCVSAMCAHHFDKSVSRVWMKGGLFSLMQKHLSTNSLKTRLVFESIVLIHNFCTELVGSNQIQPVFDPKHEWCISLVRYDRSNQYSLCPNDLKVAMMAVFRICIRGNILFCTCWMS